MSLLYIREYVSLAKQDGRLVPAGEEPGYDQSPVDFTGGVASSAKLRDSTNFVRLQADAGCHINFDGTATTSNAPLTADVAEFFGVRKGLTISVIAAV